MRSVEERIELANAFVYTAVQQAQIVALMQPLKWSTERLFPYYKGELERGGDVSDMPANPEDACLHRVTGIARDGLRGFLEPHDTPKQEKERLQQYAAALELAASELEGPRREFFSPRLISWLIRLQDKDPSLPIDFFADCRPVASALRRHAGLARLVLDRIDAFYAASFLAGVRNPNRWRLAFDLLDWQKAETGKPPARSRSSAAAKMLLAALDPAMIYANRILEISEALPLRTGENAANVIRRWAPLLPYQEEE